MSIAGYCLFASEGGQAHIVTPNRLQRQFEPERSDGAWVTYITHIRTHKGWLYLAAQSKVKGYCTF